MRFTRSRNIFTCTSMHGKYNTARPQILVALKVGVFLYLIQFGECLFWSVLTMVLTYVQQTGLVWRLGYLSNENNMVMHNFRIKMNIEIRYIDNTLIFMVLQ